MTTRPRNVYVLGAPQSVLVDADTSTREALERTGWNTGNLLIAHALLHQIDHNVIGVNASISAAQVEALCDLIVIPAANFIFEGFDFGYAADIIEQTTLPCFMVGIGAQAKAMGTKITIRDGTLRFLKLVSERTRLIGARGEYTASVLADAGIKNVQVTGCPSFYLNRRPDFQVLKKDLRSLPRFAVNGSRDVVVHSMDPEAMKAAERALIQQAIRWGADFIAQTELPEIQLARRLETETANLPQLLAPLHAFYQGIAEPETISDYFMRHAKVFFAIEEWAGAIRSYDFVCGSRFHGNMIALQNGVPSFVFAHDARTEEMCRFFAMPHARVTDIKSVDLRSLYENIDIETFNQRYAGIYEGYVEFFRANGFELSSPSAAGVDARQDQQGEPGR